MNDTSTVIPNHEKVMQMSRVAARDTLKRSPSFARLPAQEQRQVYQSVVEDEMNKTRARYGLARSMATDSGKDMGYKGYDPAFGGDTQSFKELVDSVDFPKFVADLLKAVFDANLVVMKQQTDAYIKLMKEATKSSADFIKQVKDDDAFATMAESKSDKYNVLSEKQPDGSSKLALSTPEGEKADVEDAEVKKDILEAKIQMAKEHRAALREVLLMGVTRLVVEKGEVEAGVDFTITANRKSDAHHEDQNINTTSINASYGGGLAGIFGGPSGSIESTNTNIQVNTSTKATNDTLSANLHGKVNIKFKTDYFKLDNFLTMYSDGGTAALKPASPGGAPGSPTLPAAR